MADAAPVLLLSRPEAASRRFAGAIEAEGMTGVETIISPLLRIVPRPALPGMEGVEGIIFTSANAVACYRDLGGRPLPLCYTVGEATARAAKMAGFAPRSAGADAEALVALIRAEAPRGRLLHLRGDHARGAVAERLAAAGLDVGEAVIYDQPAQALSKPAQELLEADAPVVVPLFSPRSAALFADGARKARAPLFVAAMSRDVAGALDGLYVKRQEIPVHPDAAQMRSVVIGLLKDCGALVKGHGSVKSWTGTDSVPQDRT